MGSMKLRVGFLSARVVALIILSAFVLAVALCGGSLVTDTTEAPSESKGIHAYNIAKEIAEGSTLETIMQAAECTFLSTANEPNWLKDEILDLAAFDSSATGWISAHQEVVFLQCNAQAVDKNALDSNWIKKGWNVACKNQDETVTYVKTGGTCRWMNVLAQMNQDVLCLTLHIKQI